MPNLGNVQLRGVHLPQKTWPQARQWCCRNQISLRENSVFNQLMFLTLRTITENCTRQRWQLSPSIQLGALSAANIASLSLNAGKVYPSAFKMFKVSWTIRYFGLLRKAKAQVWTSSRILERTFSFVVLWTISLSSSIKDLEATSSCMGDPQFLTTDSSTW